MSSPANNYNNNNSHVLADTSSNNFIQSSSNPMMERIRSTLYEQLQQTRDRVKLELTEQEDALKQSKRLREDAGVELYGMQQQLSRLQANLQSVDEQYESISQERIEGQAQVLEAKEGHTKRAKRAEDLRREASKKQEELDAILEKVRQAKKYNDAMKSEVAITRTVATKTKEDLKARTKSKVDQDTYIDSLNTQVTRLEDDITLTGAQLRAQKEQSADANNMIRETSDALDKLAREQKRLVQQWNSSVVALGRRDQALLVATQALRRVQDSIRDIDNENARLERDITSLQESNGSRKISRDRLDNDIVFTETNITKVQSNLDSLSEKFEMLQQTLKNTHQEEKSLVSVVSKIESEITTANHKCELLLRERHKIEEKISTMRHEQMSMSKVAQNLAREEKVILTKIHKKEIESATLLNEIARLDIDRLNTQAHNTQLEDKLNTELDALKGTEAKIDEQEVVLRRCNDEIEKKTIRVAKLNREYNKMVQDCGGDEEPTGPLEATIKSLSKEIEQETTDIRGLQREWLLKQTELIKTISQTNAIQEKDSESTARLAILRQKLLRLVQDIHTNETSIKSIDYKSRGLHTDITRLNDLIEQNARRQEEYENKIAVHAMEFERELSELDQQSAHLESQIAEVQSNKTKMLDEISHTQEQLKIWENKIQVEKETQEELRSSKDAIDTKGMEKEIQRMKHRLESLVRTQEQLLRDMELAIHKREDIAVKYKKNVSSAARNKSRQHQHNTTMTKGEMTKHTQAAREKLMRLEQTISEAANCVAASKSDLLNIKTILHDNTQKLQATADKRQQLEASVSAEQFEMNRLSSLVDLHEELKYRYEKLAAGEVPKVATSARTEFDVERQLAKSSVQMNKLSDTIAGLSMKFNHYEDIFDRMQVLTRVD